MEPSRKQEKQETVVVENYTKKMGYVQSQPHTHFRLKHQSDREKLLHAIQNASTTVPIVASYDYGRKHNTDIIIRKVGDSNSAKPIGKIHLLLFDRRDRYHSEKYYMKLHFFKFANDEVFNSVKQAVTDFFNRLDLTEEPYSANRTPKNRNNRNNRTQKHSPALKFDTITQS